jgi:hypothetical protein
MSNIYKEVFLAALNGGLSRNHSVDEAIISAAKAASNVVSNDYIMRKIKESEGEPFTAQIGESDPLKELIDAIQKNKDNIRWILQEALR